MVPCLAGRLTCVHLSWLLQLTAAMKREARKVREAERVEKLALTRKDREEIFEVSEVLEAPDALPTAFVQPARHRQALPVWFAPPTVRAHKLAQLAGMASMHAAYDRLQGHSMYAARAHCLRAMA